MSIPNRTVSITGVFAADASTTIPSAPVSGVAYRNTAMTGTVIREGWAYKTIVDSANFNQALYEYSSVTAQVEKYGFLPWSNLTDYVQGSVCLGSNGKIYQAKQATGPSSTAYDPTSNPNVWDPVILGVTEFLFHHIWTDYQLDRQDWLRADTFSWQNGTVYTNAYNHLVDDISGVSSSTETIGSYTVTYYQATDGHKICFADQETTLANIYNESGVAWYYILDTTNQRFKLPRENPAREELIQVLRAKGSGLTLGLTDGTNNAGLNNSTGSDNRYVWTTDQYGQNVGHTSGASSYLSGTDRQGIGVTTDSTKSGIISNMTDSTSVYKGNKYLYFYVGQFSQSATEQTAGLNASLFNGKVDLDGSNAAFAHIVETYRNGSDWYRIYSDGWIEQGGVCTTADANYTTTITLLKAMSDTNYSIVTSGSYGDISGNDSTNATRRVSALLGGAVRDKTTTNFKLATSVVENANLMNSWRVSGYLY